MTEWNQWREVNQRKDIELEGANFSNFYLKGARFDRKLFRGNSPKAYFQKARFNHSNLEDINLEGAYLEDVIFWDTHLVGANLNRTHLQKAKFLKVHLDNAKLNYADLRNAFLVKAHLKDAELKSANLTCVNLGSAQLQGSELRNAHLEGANMLGASLQDASFLAASVDGTTLIWKPKVNRFSKGEDATYTDFSGVALSSVRIDPLTKQLLEYNIRRKYWEMWYNKNDWYEISPNKDRSKLYRAILQPVCWFWWISDYGISTKRIIFTFFGLAFVFALLYRLFPNFVMVYGDVGYIRGFWHALYFSIVTMTTLGFGDIAANPDSWVGQTLLMIQVILGYVLLGALVTRFAVLFTAGGPTGRFADEQTISDRLSRLWAKIKGKDAKQS